VSRARRLLPPPALLLMAGLLVAGVGGCTTEAKSAPVEGEPASPFAECTTLSASPSLSASPVSAVKPDLPDLELPCFTGGQPFRLADLRGPAVINLWASWCAPCREELPAMQRLADRTAGRLHVIGVDTADARDDAASFGAAQDVDLPTLFDRDKALGLALGTPNLPATVYLDADGGRFVYNQAPLDDAGIAKLVRTHTGVTVSP
jgi:cytochrome c biogenesis protein CcmG/thiol:disulfide interchange protein DsbE